MSELPERAEGQAQVWLRFAQEDLRTARRVVRDEEPVMRIAGFLAQQSAEKALKAVLVAHMLPVPKIHNLYALATSLPVPADDLDRDDCALLNPWITAGRCPGNLPVICPGALPDRGREKAQELCSAAEAARGVKTAL